MHLADLGSVLGVLSAMITPAVLILACGSLTLTTANRLTRAIDRVREEVANLQRLGPDGDADRRRYLLSQLDRSTMRARKLQRSITMLYLSLGSFITTSVAIGVVALVGKWLSWLPLILGFVGCGFLFYTSMLLIFESRIALQQTYAEMDFSLQITK